MSLVPMNKKYLQHILKMMFNLLSLEDSLVLTWKIQIKILQRSCNQLQYLLFKHFPNITSPMKSKKLCSNVLMTLLQKLLNYPRNLKPFKKLHNKEVRCTLWSRQGIHFQQSNLDSYGLATR